MKRIIGVSRLALTGKASFATPGVEPAFYRSHASALTVIHKS